MHKKKKEQPTRQVLHLCKKVIKKIIDINWNKLRVPINLNNWIRHITRH